MKEYLFVFILCFVFALPGFSHAEEATGAKEALVTMEEVIVTATKTKEKRGDISNSVILMDEMDIQESSAKSLGELLANELGIDWRTYGNYGGASQEVHIRGMGGDATQIFVNGVNVNSPSLGVADVAKIPLNSIERIEVVKGSGSLLYGTGAMGGTINIITKGPKRDKMDLKASAGYGSEGTYHLSAEQGMFLPCDVGYYLTASRRETDGFRDNSDLTYSDVSLKLVYGKADILDISFYGDYIDREYGRPGVKPPPGTQDFYTNGEQVYSSDAQSMLDRGSDEDAHLVLEVKSNPSERLGLKVRGDYTYMKNYNLTRYYDSWTGGVPGSKTWTTNKVSTIEGNIDVKPFEGSSLLLGADYRGYYWKNENVDLDDNGAELSGAREKTKAHLYSKGVYAEAQYRPYKYFKVLAGIRHENHSTFGFEDLPRFGLIVNPFENTVLKFSRGKHFKAPTPNDLFWPDDGWATGNPELKPEKGWHTDATLEQGLYDDKLFFSLSYFHWDIEDKIAWAENPNYPTIFPGLNKWTPSNVDTFEGRGWEVGLKIGPLRNMILSLDYTYTDAEEQKKGGPKRQALYTPDNQFKGVLTYWAGFGLSATATVRYVGERPYYANDTDVDPTKTLPHYWTADLKIEQRLYDHWTLALHGNNLFDKGYETYVANFRDSTGTPTLSGYPGSGLSVFFSVGYEY